MGLLALPKDVLLLICEQLDGITLGRLRMVCQRLNYVLSEATRLWQALACDQWGRNCIGPMDYGRLVGALNGWKLAQGELECLRPSLPQNEFVDHFCRSGTALLCQMVAMPDNSAELDRSRVYAGMISPETGALGSIWSCEATRERVTCRGKNGWAVGRGVEEIFVERGWDSQTPEILGISGLEHCDCAVLSSDGETLLVARDDSFASFQLEQTSQAASWKALRRVGEAKSEAEESEDEAINFDGEFDNDDEEEDGSFQASPSSASFDSSLAESGFESGRRLPDRHACRSILPLNRSPFVSYLIADNAQVTVWDRRAPEPHVWPHRPTLQEAVCGALSHDDLFLAVGLRDTVRLYDVRNDANPSNYLTAARGETRRLEFFGRECLVALCSLRVELLPTISAISGPEALLFPWGDWRAPQRPCCSLRGFRGAGNSLVWSGDKIVFNTFGGGPIQQLAWRDFVQ